MSDRNPTGHDKEHYPNYHAYHGSQAGDGDTTKVESKKKAPPMNLSDSIRKYEDKMGDASSKGDVSGTRSAAKKYAGFYDEYTNKGLESDLSAAKANIDSAKKYGGYNASLKQKLKPAGGQYYGAEIVDTTDYVKDAKKNAAKKKGSKP